MVKKYKLAGSDNKSQSGGNLHFMYPMVPNMTGLMPSTTPLVSSKIVAGVPLTQPGMTAITSSGSYIRSDPAGNLKIGMPLVSGTGDGLKMIIPPKVDPRDPSVFLAVDSSAKSKTSGPIKDVTMSYKEPMPKQSLVMFQPNLPMLPNPYGLQLPVGMQPTAPILINPTESQARLEISSPDSEDIITVSGEQDKIKPIYEGIQKNNKVRLAQEEVTLAGAEYDRENTIAKLDFDAIFKKRTEAEINADTTIADPLKKAGLRLKKAKEALKVAKKTAGLVDDDTDVGGSDLIPLDKLFNLSEIINTIKTKFGAKDDEFKAESTKKNSLQLLLGLPFRSHLNYGPMISGL